MTAPWTQIEAEARGAFASFPLRAYSELMPAPWIGIKPYAPTLANRAATCAVDDLHVLDIDEYEQAHDLEPGLTRIAKHLTDELAKLIAGQSHALSRSLLDGNPAWPPELAERAGKLAHDRTI